MKYKNTQVVGTAKVELTETPAPPTWPPIVIDAHMHVMSGNCTPFPAMLNVVQDNARDQSGVTGIVGAWLFDPVEEPVKLSRRLENVGSLDENLRAFTRVSGKSTYRIGEATIAANREISSIEAAETTRRLLANSRMLWLSVVLPMDMDYCHVGAYEGKQVYRLDASGKWCYDKITERDYVSDKVPDTVALEGTSAINLCAEDAAIEMRADIEALEYRSSTFAVDMQELAQKRAELEQYEQSLYTRPGHEDSPLATFETWSQQRRQTAMLAAEYPFQLVPMYHYEPRRYTKDAARLRHGYSMDESASTIIDEAHPFKEVVCEGNTAGIYNGFKMYTSQGYMPDDPNPGVKEVLQYFYDRCEKSRIPIMNHCTPSGFYTHQRQLFLHHEIKRMGNQDLARVERMAYRLDRVKHPKRELEALKSILTPEARAMLGYLEDPNGRMRFFQEKYVHPESWRPVLEKYPKLHVCLAHFACDIKFWDQFDPGDIVKRDLDEGRFMELLRKANWSGTKLRDKWDPAKDGDYAKPTYDASETVYRLCWVRSIVKLCLDFPNFYVDISVLPLDRHEEKEKHKTWQKIGALIHRHPEMKSKIMFGTDWYMMRTSDSYQKWIESTFSRIDAMSDEDSRLAREAAPDAWKTELEARKKAIKDRNKELSPGPEESLQVELYDNLFYRFAIINPIRFYRLDEHAGYLNEGLKVAIGKEYKDDENMRDRLLRQLEERYALFERFKSKNAEDKTDDPLTKFEIQIARGRRERRDEAENLDAIGTLQPIVFGPAAEPPGGK